MSVYEEYDEDEPKFVTIMVGEEQARFLMRCLDGYRYPSVYVKATMFDVKYALDQAVANREANPNSYEAVQHRIWKENKEEDS